MHNYTRAILKICKFADLTMISVQFYDPLSVTREIDDRWAVINNNLKHESTIFILLIHFKYISHRFKKNM